eukprot:4993603-Ditylum_brightwellii.AAC.1
MSYVHCGNWSKNYLTSLRQQDTRAVSHMAALPVTYWVHHVHTGLVGQTGSARQLKLLEGHPRPGQWHIKSPKRGKYGLTDENSCWWEPWEFLLKVSQALGIHRSEEPA